MWRLQLPSPCSDRYWLSSISCLFFLLRIVKTQLGTAILPMIISIHHPIHSCHHAPMPCTVPHWTMTWRCYEFSKTPHTKITLLDPISALFLKDLTEPLLLREEITLGEHVCPGPVGATSFPLGFYLLELYHLFVLVLDLNLLRCFAQTMEVGVERLYLLLRTVNSLATNNAHRLRVPTKTLCA
jgi:hypothetical protein